MQAEAWPNVVSSCGSASAVALEDLIPLAALCAGLGATLVLVVSPVRGKEPVSTLLARLLVRLGDAFWGLG
jgi:hypothetical protein